MTLKELERGKDLLDEIEKLSMNIDHLERALNYNERSIKKFSFRSIGQKEIKISGDCVSFGGCMSVDRGMLELILNYCKNKLAEVNAEFERLGKDGK